MNKLLATNNLKMPSEAVKSPVSDERKRPKNGSEVLLNACTEHLSERDKANLRRIVVNEAISWIGTPYRANCMQKGRGVDCARFGIVPYQVAGLISWGVQIPPENSEWFLDKNRDPYKFKNFILRFGVEIPFDERLPADIATFLVEGIETHISILRTRDRIIHASMDSTVKEQRLLKIPTFRSIYRHKDLV
jgi:hypothetical protein